MESLTIVDACNVRESTDVDPGSDALTLTKNESLVYTALQKADRPIKAYELLDLLYDKGLKAPMTIYRALEGLQEKALAQKVFSQNAFVSIDHHMRARPRAVVTCRQCGSARLVPLAKRDITALLGAADMPMTDLVIEAVGECDGDTCPTR